MLGKTIEAKPKSAVGKVGFHLVRNNDPVNDFDSNHYLRHSARRLETQPRHEDFPLDWNVPAKYGDCLHRAIFIASRGPLDNESLSLTLLAQQAHHE